MNKRIVITGIGLVTSIGIGKENFTNNLKKGTSGISDITQYDTSSFKSKKGGLINNFNVNNFLSGASRKMGRASQLAVAASKLAIDDANLVIANDNNYGVVLGTYFGALEKTDAFLSKIMINGARHASPILFPDSLQNVPAAHVSLAFKLKGLNITETTGSAAGLKAITIACDLINSNRADIILAGGTEEFSAICWKSYNYINHLSPDDHNEEMMRPYDEKRNGTILGEGSAILVLESYESAVKRNANIYCEISGYDDMTDFPGPNKIDKNGNGLSKVMMNNIKSSNISINDIDLICGSANSDKTFDSAEGNAITKVFESKKPMVSNIKSMIGESFGASGAINLAAASISVKDNFIFPTINTFKVDSKFNIDLTKELISKKVSNVLVTAYDYGGFNASVLLKKAK